MGIKSKSFNLFLLMFFLLFMRSSLVGESLFDADNYRSFVQDIKAHRVGDTVTLLVVENAAANASTDTSTRSVLELGGSIGKTSSTEVGSLNANVGHQGGGGTMREANVRANITVTVVEKGELGQLFVKGAQLIVVNGDEQTISASGWLRQEDIAPNNTALSTRLSDSKIEFGGEGLLDTERKPGFFHWLAKKLRLV